MMGRAREWIAEVEDAYSDGGYASGDGPPAPLDEMKYLVAEVERLREGIRDYLDGQPYLSELEDLRELLAAGKQDGPDRPERR